MDHEKIAAMFVSGDNFYRIIGGGKGLGGFVLFLEKFS